MKIITINVSDTHLAFFDMLSKSNIFPSRSEAIRYCIESATPKILKELGQVKNYIEEKDTVNLKKYMEEQGFEIKKIQVSKKENIRKPLGNIWWKEINDENGDIIRVPKDVLEVEPKTVMRRFSNG